MGSRLFRASLRSMRSFAAIPLPAVRNQLTPSIPFLSLTEARSFLLNGGPGNRSQRSMPSSLSSLWLRASVRNNPSAASDACLTPPAGGKERTTDLTLLRQAAAGMPMNADVRERPGQALGVS